MEEVCRYLYENEFPVYSRTGITGRIILRKSMDHIPGRERKKAYWEIAHSSDHKKKIVEFADKDDPYEVIKELMGMDNQYAVFQSFREELCAEIKSLEGECVAMAEVNPREFLHPRKQFLTHVSNDYGQSLTFRRAVQRMLRAMGDAYFQAGNI